MQYERVKVKRDTSTVHNRAFPPWEIPVLEFIFEDGNIEHLDVFEDVPGEYPDAAKEFDRLTRCYGSDPKSGVPYVASVYGEARAGVRALAEAIKAAKAEAKPTPTKRGAKRAAEADSLLG